MPEHIDHEPRLLFPSLKSFYDVVIPLAWPVIRIAVGLEDLNDIIADVRQAIDASR